MKFSYAVRAALAVFAMSISLVRAEVPLLSNSSAREYERRFAALVSARHEAIRRAFGELLDNSTGDIRIEFADPRDPFYPTTNAAAYDPARDALVFRRAILIRNIGSVLPPWVYSYWTYYEHPNLPAEAPIVRIVDDALWSAHLLEAAEQRGLTWPHESCVSLELAQRLGCEMLVAGVYEALRSRRSAIFNANRLDRIWPENLQELRGHASRRNDPQYHDVRRFGGASILQPLVREFGTTRVLAYVAQTPFRIENENVRVSALRYQEQARNALAW